MIVYLYILSYFYTLLHGRRYMIFLLFFFGLYYNASGDVMYRIKEDSVSELEIKKSRFITYLHRTVDEEDAKAFIASIRRLHPNATHHCYAFLIGEQSEIRRSNDDGEPSGTAGVPMLECLDRSHIQDITAVTVRYFGGIKLGTSGLINAYKTATADALQQAEKTEKIVTKLFLARFPYEQMNLAMRLVKELQLQVLRQEADMECRLWLSVRLSDAARCQKRFEEERIPLENVNS